MNVDYIKLLKDNLNDFGEWKEIDNEIAQCLLSKFGSKNYLARIFNPANDKEKIKIELERTETYLGKKLSGEFLDFLKQSFEQCRLHNLMIEQSQYCLVFRQK